MFNEKIIFLKKDFTPTLTAIYLTNMTYVKYRLPKTTVTVIEEAELRGRRRRIIANTLLHKGMLAGRRSRIPHAK